MIYTRLYGRGPSRAEVVPSGELIIRNHVTGLAEREPLFTVLSDGAVYMRDSVFGAATFTALCLVGKVSA